MLRHLGATALSARVLSRASTPVLRIGSVTDVGAALALMHLRRVGALLVCDPAGAGSSEDAVPLGILTERDVLEKIDFDTPLATVRVGDVMTPQQSMQLAAAEDSLDDVLSRMVAGGFRHMPVVRGALAIGMVSMRDIAHAIIAGAKEQESAVTASVLCSARSRTINLGCFARPSCIEAPPASTVADAVLMMRQWGADSVLVPSEGPSVGRSRHACGIFTERDYIRLLGSATALNQSIDPRRVDLARCCTPASELVSATAATPAMECLARMAHQHVRHLPVMQDVEADADFELGESDEPPAPPSLLAVLSARDVLAQFLPRPSIEQVAAAL